MKGNTHELLETTYTKANLSRKAMLLEEFFSKYFFTENQEGEKREGFKNFLLEENVGEYLRSSLLALSNDFYNQFSADNFRQLLNQLKEEEKNRPHITIYVATLLPPIEIEKLGKWARDNVAPGIFMDIEIDGGVVGGCAFVWNGVYHDYSLRYYIDKKRTEIRTLLTESK